MKIDPKLLLNAPRSSHGGLILPSRFSRGRQLRKFSKKWLENVKVQEYSLLASCYESGPNNIACGGTGSGGLGCAGCTGPNFDLFYSVSYGYAYSGGSSATYYSYVLVNVEYIPPFPADTGTLCFWVESGSVTGAQDDGSVWNDVGVHIGSMNPDCTCFVTLTSGNTCPTGCGPSSVDVPLMVNC